MNTGPSFLQWPLCRLAAALALAGTAPGLLAAPMVQREPAVPAASAGQDNAEAQFRAGVEAQMQGDLRAAGRHFDSALKQQPSHVPSLLGRAGVALAEGKPAEAETLVARAEKLSPGTLDVLLARGRLQVAQGDTARAERTFQDAKARHPKAMPPRLELGDLQLRGRRVNEALATFREAVALDAANKFAVFGLGSAAAAAGQPAEARGAFERAAALAPSDPAPHRALGRLHLEAGELPLALAAFDASLARQPGFVPAMLDRTDALARQGRWADATAQAESAARAAPRAPEVLLKLADVHQGAGRFEAAEAGYRRVIEIAPRHPVAYNNVAWMTITRGGDARQAVADARRAVELSPRSSPFHDTLGWALRAAGDLPGAAAALAQAIRLEGNVPGYHYHLGVVQLEMKQPAAARQSLTRFLELAPQSPDAADARRRLQGLPA